MQKKNVCKFIPDGQPSELRTVRFIFERDPGAQKKPMTQSGYIMYLVSHGKGRITFSDRPVSVGVGDLVFGFPGEICMASGEALEYYYITFEGQRGQELLHRFGVTPVHRRFSGFEGALPFWEESITRATSENVDIVSECVLMYTFSRLTGVKDPNRDVASLLASYAEENFSDGGLSLNSLADDWGYNAKYLSDCFKKRMGMGFSHYLKTLRVKHAVFLMEHGVESVKNVAYLCGFRDPLYFSKVFRESLGVSPKEYLRRNREGNAEA